MINNNYPESLEDTETINNNDNFECITCSKIFNRSELKYCRICDSDVCSKCYDERSVLYFSDWLYDCSNRCTKCNIIGCKECINLCYSCANTDCVFDVYCHKCKTFITVDCEYHTWMMCDKHSIDECELCHVNKNYTLKHTIH